MFVYPKGLYVDVRIEEKMDTRISYKQGVLQEQKVRENKGVFIRVFDGAKWFYSSLSDLSKIQDQINVLAEMATPNPSIHTHPVVQAFEVHQDEVLKYQEGSLAEISIQEKDEVLRDFLGLVKDQCIVHEMAFYVDNKTVKKLYSSKGNAIIFDKQSCGIGLQHQLVYQDHKDMLGVSSAEIYLKDLNAKKAYYQKEVEKNVDFIKRAETFEPGMYPVLLSPLATGVFTHESFGHKSEADFMIGDETMRKEWAMGKKIGQPLLNITDNGMILGNGYVLYDDEGTKGQETKIITEGALTGRLHSISTSVALEEKPTGNARSIGFEFEPIVRMTTTYIEKGETPLSEIVSSIKEGVFIDTIKHGSGMSTFTIAPARAYKIVDGKIDVPIKLSVVTGNVFKTLELVDAISEEFELLSFVGGGCGKMEQFPLPVGFGGPFTLVRELNVQ